MSVPVMTSLADQIRTAYAECLEAYPDDVAEDRLLGFLQQEVAETVDPAQSRADIAAQAVQTLDTVIGDIRHLQTSVEAWGRED